MTVRTLAHLSDLHLGLDPSFDHAAEALCRTLLALDVDHVIVTGDLTHKGRHSELARFTRAFEPLIDAGRLSVVPGNHDRVGEDAGRDLLGGSRVVARESDGVFQVLVDSTGDHNRSYFAPHGEICRTVLRKVDALLDAAPEHHLVVIALHHHPVPMPEETLGERLASSIGLPHARELALGEELVKLAHGRADLILHGHRHVPRERSIPGAGPRALSIYNGGASTELQRFRLFSHTEGRVLDPPRWIHAGAIPARPERAVPQTWARSALRELSAVFA
ncbi:MAG: metallophosphoesterase [Myxococcaceae bacterium]|nr:metallophosphoesterase [Myxococcaceae bacterium]